MDSLCDCLGDGGGLERRAGGQKAVQDRAE